jgi:hypothetical protein
VYDIERAFEFSYEDRETLLAKSGRF